MRLTLRPEWRLWPLSSFFGFLDIKTGVTVALLFALLNKVAGIYGLIAVLTGAGGSFAQLSLYIYSAMALVALGWGLNAVKEEDAKHTLYFAHLFFADHILSTAWTVFFAVVWWVYTPHDGRRQANSAAQEEMMKGGGGRHHMSESDREAAAMRIWNHEKGTAAAIIIISWFFKIYFAILLYSYAWHLRKGSYRSLLLSRPNPHISSAVYDSVLAEEEEEEVEDFYRAHIRPSRLGGSVSSFTDFANVPGRPRRPTGAGRFSRSALGKDNGHVNGNDVIEVDEVLFDEEELSSRGHSRFGTEESMSSSSQSEGDRLGNQQSRSRS